MEVLLEAVLEGEYDPRCTRIEVALRAIWLLYRRKKWDLLERAGIDQETFDILFWAYADQLLTENGEARIRTDQQTLAFLRYVRGWGRGEAIQLLSAAVWLIGQYMTRRMRVRAAWYGKDLPA